MSRQLILENIGEVHLNCLKLNRRANLLLLWMPVVRLFQTCVLLQKTNESLAGMKSTF